MCAALLWRGRGREKTTGERYLTFVALRLLPLVLGGQKNTSPLPNSTATERGSLESFTFWGSVDSDFILKEERDANGESVFFPGRSVLMVVHVLCRLVVICCCG